MGLPPLTPAPATDTPRLPAGAQMIFTQARAMDRAGAAPGKTTLHWHISGPMDEAAMCRAMDTLALRRDYLHLKVDARDGRGIVRPATPEPVRVETAAPEDLADEMSTWCGASQQSSQKPSCALRLLKLQEEQYAVGLSGPHDLLDVWTIDRTLASLARLYNGQLDSRPAELEPAPGFRDYCAWHETLMETGQLDASREFWQRLLEGVSPVFDAPPAPDTACHPMAKVQSFMPLDNGLCERFEGRAHAAGASVFEGYLTLFNLALAKITGKQTLLTAFVASLRRVQGLGDVEGCLLNRFYIPVRLTRDTDFESAAGQVSRILKSAKAHCLWPAWQDVDPQAAGYPGLFFHYVPPVKGRMPEFKNLSVAPYTLVPPKSWPQPMIFQVVRNTGQPMLAAVGQAGFCCETWLKKLQETFIGLMEKG